jgi:hypothetical protein
MRIPRDPKENGPTVGAWKFSQIFVIAERTVWRRLLRFPLDEGAIRQNENGAAALFVVFWHRLVIGEAQEIRRVHAATIHKILRGDSGSKPAA